MKLPSSNIVNKFLRIRLQNSEVYSFVKHITTIICSIHNIPLLAMYAGGEEIRFYGVSANKEAFQNSFQSPLPDHYQVFFPPLKEKNNTFVFEGKKIHKYIFTFSGLEIVFLFLCPTNMVDAITQSLVEIEDTVAMLLLPMIQDEEWVNSSRLKESLRITNQYVQSFSFLESLLQLLLKIIKIFSKAEYLTVHYKAASQEIPTFISIGNREEKKYNTHTYSDTSHGFFTQITINSSVPLPNSSAEMYRMNRTCRLTAQLVYLYHTKPKDFYIQSHIAFTKIYQTLLSPSPDQLDQMLAMGQLFSTALALSIPEWHVLKWLIVLDNAGVMAIKLLSQSGDQPWEIDYSTIVKKSIIDSLGIPIQSPQIVTIDKNLFKAILTCVRAYSSYIHKKPFHNREEMINEIQTLEVPENFLPIFLKLMEKNSRLKCYEITHCSKELRDICPIFKQLQSENPPSILCHSKVCLRNEILGIQCKQCIVYNKQEENHAQ